MSTVSHSPGSADAQSSRPAPSTADVPHQAAAPTPEGSATPPRRSPGKPRGLQPSFAVLIGLTLVTAILLIPFAVSPQYLAYLRANSVDLHTFLRGELYKQSTGYVALTFVLIEVLLTARKRGRGWLIRVKLPGSMQFWRVTHIFLGVGLVAMVLVHTIGATGLNFNAIFLWVFFIVTLTALVGVVAETGILESTRSQFGKLPGSGQVLTKGPLIRGLRSLWLVSHIFFVCIFAVMLVFHIALVYYYQ